MEKEKLDLREVIVYLLYVLVGLVLGIVIFFGCSTEKEQHEPSRYQVSCGYDIDPRDSDLMLKLTTFFEEKDYKRDRSMVPTTFSKEVQDGDVKYSYSVTIMSFDTGNADAGWDYNHISIKYRIHLQKQQTVEDSRPFIEIGRSNIHYKELEMDIDNIFDFALSRDCY